MRLTLIALGSRSAGPIYSFQMAQALSKNAELEMQIIISKEVDNMNSWDEEFLGRRNVHYHKIDTYKHNTLSVLASFLNPFKIGKLIKLVNNFKPDVVYCPFGLMWSSLVFPFLKNTKIITTLHDPHPYTHGYTLSQFLLANVGVLGEKFVKGRVVLNNKDYSYVLNKYRSEVQVIPHAAYSFYVPKNYLQKSELTYRIAFMGRIDLYKGVDILVKAFVKLKTKGVKLLIAGSGHIDEEIMRIIDSDINIELHNRYIANEEIPMFMQEVDMVVLPYTNATQSGVIPMAFAFGKMVIATNVGSLAEQVPTGTGLLVSPNVDSIARAIDRMYSEENKILEFSNNAKCYADNNLTWEHSADLLFEFAKKIGKI